jgi:transposase
MGYIQGERRNQGTLFPVVLDDLIPADHVCRVIDAFVDGLSMAELSFERAEAAETRRPGYDPRDLLKLYLYGYLNQLRSSRRLEAECRRNVELMWLLGRLYPDHKSIAEFRRMHRDGITAVGAELVRFARSCGLIRGEWIAIDGTKFRAVSSQDSVREREALRRYLDSMESADSEQQPTIDPSAVQAAIEKLRQHPEPEARFMPVAGTKAPAHNVQTAVDAEHALIVAHAITLNAGDSDCLEPMAEAARKALESSAPINILADKGYSNGEQASRCEEAGMIPHVPPRRGINNKGDGSLLDRSAFLYQPETDSFLCPEGKTLKRLALSRRDRAVYYQAEANDCGNCSLKNRCTKAPQRLVTRHLYDEVLNRMQQRATADKMRLRRFATLKYQIFGHPRFLLRGLYGSRTEISLAVMAYNLKRMINVLGAEHLTQVLNPARGENHGKANASAQIHKRRPPHGNAFVLMTLTGPCFVTASKEGPLGFWLEVIRFRCLELRCLRRFRCPQRRPLAPKRYRSSRTPGRTRSAPQPSVSMKEQSVPPEAASAAERLPCSHGCPYWEQS